MTEFLLSLIPTCLLIWAIHILFQKDMIFEKVGNWMENNLPKYVNKPLWMCPICQSSIWGIIGFFSLQTFNVHLPTRLLIDYVFCLCGLNTIISKLVNKERIIVDE